MFLNIVLFAMQLHSGVSVDIDCLWAPFPKMAVKPLPVFGFSFCLRNITRTQKSKIVRNECVQDCCVVGRSVWPLQVLGQLLNANSRSTGTLIRPTCRLL